MYPGLAGTADSRMEGQGQGEGQGDREGGAGKKVDTVCEAVREALVKLGENKSVTRAIFYLLMPLSILYCY